MVGYQDKIPLGVWVSGQNSPRQNPPWNVYDPLGLIRQVFNHSGEGFLQSLVDMANDIQRLFLWSGVVCGLNYLRRIRGLLKSLIIITASSLSPLLVLLPKKTTEK